MKIKNILKNWKVLTLIIFLILAILAINPRPWNDGVSIRSITTDSAAFIAGIKGPTPDITPVNRERITEFNNIKIKNMQDYADATKNLVYNSTVSIKTNKRIYHLIVKPEYKTTVLDEIENVTVTKSIFNNETNETEEIEVVEQRNKIVKEIIGTEDLGITVYDAPTTNIRKGLDLQGGTRVLLKPERELTTEETSSLIDNLKERLNVYGLSDIVVREATDLSGNQYITVEIAGATEQEVKDLIGKEGKFEAKVSNVTVFAGGNDITYVCRSADCAGLDPQGGCSKITEGYMCRFRFSISLSPEAAQKQADQTGKLSVVTEDGYDYLNESIYLYLDDVEVDSLRIGSELKGKASTDIQISGSGIGTTREEAVYNALSNMKKLQTVLTTGSLPVKLEIIKIDQISPVLGQEFIENALWMAFFAILTVIIILGIYYRKMVIMIPIVITMLSEMIILLGFAALVNWQIDLAAIAALIVAIGTGVNHQIIITDESISSKGYGTALDWKTKIKNAFFVIMSSYATLFVAMIPLWFAGAGLVKLFALTTIAATSIGVFITRPAYSVIIEELLK